MPINPLPMLYAQQLGTGAKLVNEVATLPEAQQAMARLTAEALLRQEAQQVQKLEDPELSPAVRDREKGRENSPRDRRRRDGEPPEDEQETSPSSEGAFLGNLVNRKI